MFRTASIRAGAEARIPNDERRDQRSPVPPQRWHFTTLSPFFSRPLPSQFLHFCFFLMLGPFWLAMIDSLQATLSARTTMIGTTRSGLSYRPKLVTAGIGKAAYR